MPLKNNIGSFVVAFEARQTATRNVRPSTVSMLKVGGRDLVIDVPLALNLGVALGLTERRGGASQFLVLF
jgi:hypothetical protein